RGRQAFAVDDLGRSRAGRSGRDRRDALRLRPAADEVRDAAVDAAARVAEPPRGAPGPRLGRRRQRLLQPPRPAPVRSAGDARGGDRAGCLRVRALWDGDIRGDPMTLRSAVALLVVWQGVAAAAEPTNHRKPASDAELRYWLDNMVRYHRFTTDEVVEATGLTRDEVAAAVKRFN